mmetsp:Transcript_4412/g.11118  ORF Transcript_4412/g.11118 Transcript_4412/m.11118 type:complete len:166 (-) Transcript_4412:45-542(-)
MVHAAYWSLVVVIATPITIFSVQLGALWKLFLWVTGLDARHEYDPKNHANEELAVAVTGCDSGFGREFAMVAAQEGFVVFACCLQKESFLQFEYTDRIIPLQVNVTNDDSVEAAAKTVQCWTNEKTSSKKRVLHALCNNAGIGIGHYFDWTDLVVYQKVMDGTSP